MFFFFFNDTATTEVFTLSLLFFFNDTATTEIYTLSLHDALPICRWGPLLFMICLIGGGLWLVARDMRAHSSRLRGRMFLGMLGESLALALAFGIVVEIGRAHV